MRDRRFKRLRKLRERRGAGQRANDLHLIPLLVDKADEEGGCASRAERGCLGGRPADAGGRASARLTVTERHQVESLRRGHSLDALDGMLRRRAEQVVVHLPELVLFESALSGLVGLDGLRMQLVDREVPKGVQNFSCIDIVLLDQGHRLPEVPDTERALVVGELDQGHQRVGVAHLGADAQINKRPRTPDAGSEIGQIFSDGLEFPAQGFDLGRLSAGRCRHQDERRQRSSDDSFRHGRISFICRIWSQKERFSLLAKLPRLYAADTTFYMRRTKILATIGPATADPAMIRAVIDAGANGCRLNFSHGSVDDHAAMCRAIREQARRTGQHVEVLQDLGGPKIRTGQVSAPLTLTVGAPLVIELGDGPGGPGRVTCAFAPLFTSVSAGQRLLLDDGRLELVVTEVGAGRLVTEVVQGGVLGSRKGINIPGGVVRTEALTAKDLLDLRAGIAMGVDAVALSFVQGPEDVAQARAAAAEAGAPDMPIIAKIERPSAVDNIDDIVAVSDGIMIARGDLGIELPLETLPAVQRRVMVAARRRGVPVIVATEVLESMRTSPRPTRAEVTDAAHAVDEGADTIMLSGETAIGRFPVRTVATLSAIIEQAERAASLPDGQSGRITVPSDDIRASRHGLALCEAAVALADRAGAAAIVAVTKAGMTPRLLSALRPAARIIAATPSEQTAARLGLVWGVTSVVTDAATLLAVRDTLLSGALVPEGETIVFVAMHATLERDADNYLIVECM